MLDPIIIALLGAIGALASACGALYLRGEKLHDTLRHDRQRASELLFALLQQRREDRGERAPPTVTEWEAEPTTQVVDRAFVEASAHAQRELNGDLELLCKRYLAGTDTLPPSDKTKRVSSSIVLEAERRIAERTRK